MQRSFRNWIALVALTIGAVGCADEGVGDPCIPETIPCSDAEGKQCGYRSSESYIEATSVQCRSRLCIVRNLDNESEDIAADPRTTCEEDNKDGCVTQEQVLDSIYCTCRCDGPKTSLEFCDCPSGFSCQEILNLGGEGIRGSYCVRK
jgi:hypothetical protein